MEAACHKVDALKKSAKMFGNNHNQQKRRHLMAPEMRVSHSALLYTPLER
jgi:hypothetical protein